MDRDGTAFVASTGGVTSTALPSWDDGPRLALLLHHDDAEREFAYDRDFQLSPLADALDHAGDYGITLVSMKDDWRTVFEPHDKPTAA